MDKAARKVIFYNPFIIEKYFFISFTTTGVRNIMAIRFGIVMNVITISTKCHTISILPRAPRKTKRPKIYWNGLIDFVPKRYCEALVP